MSALSNLVKEQFYGLTALTPGGKDADLRYPLGLTRTRAKTQR